jgi:hypothetical protein
MWALTSTRVRPIDINIIGLATLFTFILMINLQDFDLFELIFFLLLEILLILLFGQFCISETLYFRLCAVLIFSWASSS